MGLNHCDLYREAMWVFGRAGRPDKMSAIVRVGLRFIKKPYTAIEMAKHGFNGLTSTLGADSDIAIAIACPHRI